MSARQQTLPETGRPTPRRGLSRLEAATYFGISASKFDQMVDDGRAPRPRRIDDLRIWDAHELELCTTDKAARSTHLAQPSVYVIGFDKYVKIGFSADPTSRITALQSGVPEILVVYFVTPGSFKDERTLHNRFAGYRLRGEWFRREGDLAAWIDGGCKP